MAVYGWGSQCHTFLLDRAGAATVSELTSLALFTSSLLGLGWLLRAAQDRPADSRAAFGESNPELFVGRDRSVCKPRIGRLYCRMMRTSSAWRLVPVN
ncbi:MAG TPA: hypothetical protein VFL97_09415 [Nitrococcus sp.]|nr:hypothetical protein [Nitrococcus sp.]